jgi:hypothetical protein
VSTIEDEAVFDVLGCASRLHDHVMEVAQGVLDLKLHMQVIEELEHRCRQGH